MAKKIKKTLYLPEWLVEILDLEGENYGGPGVVAAASINNFVAMNTKSKRSVLIDFRNREIELAYPPDDSIRSDNDKASHAARKVVARSKARSIKQKQTRIRNVPSKVQ